MSVHTIVLYHKSRSPLSKVWSDHETLKDALHYIILLYDRSLCNVHEKNTPKYCIEDVIDFLDNLYDVVFMTYEANITAYVPHDIDWVKDRVRWYWETKLFKNRRAQVTPPPTQHAERQADEASSSSSSALVPTVVVTEAPREEITLSPDTGSSVKAVAAAA